jgi:anti-sigma factor RsiW
MNCQTFVELVTAYLEDELTTLDRQAFDEHLRLCPGCDRYLAQFRTTISLLGELPEESISPAARGQLLDAFATWSARGGQPGEGGQ